MLKMQSSQFWRMKNSWQKRLAIGLRKLRSTSIIGAYNRKLPTCWKRGIRSMPSSVWILRFLQITKKVWMKALKSILICLMICFVSANIFMR